MENIFVLIDRFFKKHPMIFWCMLCIAFLVPAYFASRIHLEEDITSIIPKDEKTQALNEIFQQSKLLDKLIITVSAKDTTVNDPDSLVLFTDELAAAATSRLSPYVSGVAHQVNEENTVGLLHAINEHLPVFLEEKDYAAIDSLITVPGVKQTLERNYRTLASPAGLALKQFIAKDPSGISNLALRKLQLLQFDQQFELYDSHILTHDLKKAILFITPAYPKNNTGKNAIFLDRFDQLIDSLQNAHPGLQAHYFGGTAVAVGNAMQLRKDTLLTQGITVLFLIIFLSLYFRKATAPILVLVPAIFGALFALAFMAVFKGSISVIALGTGSVILGIAVNYSLHVLNHFRHEPDMEKLLRDLAHPMTIGSITTVGGFLCMQWVESDMLRDLGLFGAISLIGAALFSLIFLPQLIGTKNITAIRHHGWLDKFAGHSFVAGKKLLSLIFALTIFFAFYAGKVTFEPDMNSMNFMSPELKSAEQEMNQLNAFALQSVYLVSSGKDLEAALRRNEQVVTQLDTLVSKGTIKKYSGLSALLVSDSLQKIRIDRWNQYWDSGKKNHLVQLLEKEGTRIGFSTKALVPVRQLLQRSFGVVPDSVAAGMASGLLDNYIIRQDTAVKVLTLVKTRPADKPAVYAAFEGQPKLQVLDMQYVTSRLVDMVQKDFNSISWMAAAIVFIVLLVSFGRIELTLIAFIPMLITWIWILGIMALLHIPFNIVNIIISALIFGLGDDYSLFTLDGLLQEYKTGRNNTGSFRSSILLSAITTIVGLGVLIFAKHPSLRSIALIAITGIGSVVLISQLLIPVLFRALITSRTERGLQPLTAWSICTSLFAFFYFVFGALLLSVAAILFIKLNPFSGERVKYIYHVLVSKFIKSLMYIMGNVKKTVINKGDESFASPAVIISNHQSFLDILSIIMLNPRIILMTNDWVWHSPVFGFVVRMADYFPVAKGVENSIDQLREKFLQGYSIAVFPEGTRSPDGVMKRFHKGAFFLAEQLEADILPILLHGTGDTMGKGDFLLKDGHIIIEILPRIRPTDLAHAGGYAERTKSISRQFKSIHEARRQQYEQGKWFRNKLLANYIYKGPTLEWYMRIKTRLEKSYQPFIDEVPKQGRILDLGCGYGAMSYMLHFTSADRAITGIDYDEEKILTANHCFSKDDTIRFLYGDALDFGDAQYDCIIMADMLHYLNPDQQSALVIKALSHLHPSGKLIIREGDSELADKHTNTRLTEFFSTRLFGFNKSEAGHLHFMRGATIREIAAADRFQCREIKDSNFTSNIIFILTKTLEGHGT